MGAISSEVRREMLERDVDAAGVRELFEQIIANGEPPEFAAMLALQSPPGSRNTDRAFCSGQSRKMSKMLPSNMADVQKKAKAAGIETGGKYYVSGLGKYTDKAAWVTCADDVLAVAKERNLGVEGVINRKMVERDLPPKKVDLAPDLVDSLERKYLSSDPSLASKCKNPRQRQKLRAEIVEKHGRQSRKK